MKKPDREYQIKTIDDMLNCVTADNIDNFLEGFKYSMNQYLKAIELYKAVAKANKLNIGTFKNTEILQFKGFTYIDDGKQDNSTIIEV